MGVDLTIVPDRWPGQRTLAYDRLGIQGRYYDLWSELRKCATPTDTRFSWYGDEGLEDTDMTPYGDDVTYVTAQQFVKCWEDYFASDLWLDEEGPRMPCNWDQSVYSFVKSLDSQIRIFLWFH